MSFSAQQSRTRRFRRFFFYGAVLVVFLVIIKDTTYYSRLRKHDLRIVDSNPMQKWLSIYSDANLDSSRQDTIIPNIVHYVWILESAEAVLDLQLKHFISIYSANLYLSPEVIYFHTNAATSAIKQAKKEGNYWTRKLLQVPSLIVRQIDVPNFTNKGMKLDAFEHKSDFVRPRIMYEFGGIYLDFDVVPIRDMKPLRESGFNNIFGHELWEKVNNGVMLCKKGARFMEIYDREQHDAFDGEWISHSVHLLTRMANSMMAIPGEVLILERKAFIPDGWDPDAHAALFRSHHESSSSGSGSGSSSSDAGQFVTTATATEYDRKASLDNTDIETFWNLTKLRKREDWEIDYSSSYTVHALSPHIEARTPDCMEISWGYVQERRSNYAMQIYPAMWHAVKMGFISGNVQDHK